MFLIPGYCPDYAIKSTKLSGLVVKMAIIIVSEKCLLIMLCTPYITLHVVV